MDTMLGRILTRLKALGIYDNTDIMVVSDHGHSSVAGDVSLFPLRDIRSGAVVTTGTNPVDGYSVSGDVRLAQLLSDNGIAANVYDGSGCIKDPVMSGILSEALRSTPPGPIPAARCAATDPATSITPGALLFRPHCPRMLWS